MDSIPEGVIAKVNHRAAIGLLKYGVALDRSDLTAKQWLEHAQEEALDLAGYLEKLIRLNGTCEWRNSGLLIKTGCEESVDRVFISDLSDFSFCPYCGRRIEEGR
jgi:hypothetical protein